MIAPCTSTAHQRRIHGARRVSRTISYLIGDPDMKFLTFPTFVSAFLLIAGAAATSAQSPGDAPLHSADDPRERSK